MYYGTYFEHFIGTLADLDNTINAPRKNEQYATNPYFHKHFFFNFSWDGCNTQEKLKNKGYAKFWGANN